MKKIILVPLTSSETTHHHCGLQTSGSPRPCSNGAKGSSSLLVIPPDLSPLLPCSTHLVVVGCSPGVVFLREVSQVVVIVEVEARHQLLFGSKVNRRHTSGFVEKAVTIAHLTEVNPTNAVADPV